MEALEAEQRAAVVKEALSWRGTAYHHEGSIKIKRDEDGRVVDRGGVDCAYFPFLVYRSLGLIKLEQLPRYTAQWFLHQGEEIYLNLVREHATEIDGTPLAGDFVIWKIGRLYAHGAIVLDWPRIVHSVRASGGVLEDHANGGEVQDKPVKYFTLWKA